LWRHHLFVVARQPQAQLVASGRLAAVVTPELRQLRYVIEVAQQRSFTRAAERLHVAQQALSQQVKTVEDQLGVKLFERGNRGVSLTPAGSVFVQEARRVVNGAERVVRRTQAAARGETGTLRLAYTVSTAYETLPALVTALKDATSALQIQQREMTAVDLAGALLDGEQDAALCPRMTLAAGLERLEIRREPFVAAVPATDPLAARPAIAVAELADRHFQLWPRELTPGYHDAVVAACRDAGFEPQLGDAASGAAIWTAIATGHGVGLVVNSLAQQLPPGIALVPLHRPAPALIFDLIWATEHDGPLLDRLRDAADNTATRHAWTRGSAASRPSSSAIASGSLDNAQLAIEARQHLHGPGVVEDCRRGDGCAHDDEGCRQRESHCQPSSRSADETEAEA
jgi:DNA-binding transcriptional LysR family regulator